MRRGKIWSKIKATSWFLQVFKHCAVPDEVRQTKLGQMARDKTVTVLLLVKGAVNLVSGKGKK